MHLDIGTCRYFLTFSATDIISTIYTSYDVFPRKEVPFGGLDEIAPHLGGQIPQKPQFWGRE